MNIKTLFVTISLAAIIVGVSFIITTPIVNAQNNVSYHLHNCKTLQKIQVQRKSLTS
jgi:hypothetical protein